MNGSLPNQGVLPAGYRITTVLEGTLPSSAIEVKALLIFLVVISIVTFPFTAALAIMAVKTTFRMRAITALFNNMRTLKFKAQPTNVFFATVNQMFGDPSQLPTMLSELCSTIWFDYRALGSSRKLGGAAEHLIDGSEKTHLSVELCGI